MKKKTKKRIVIIVSVILALCIGGVVGVNLYVDSMLNRMTKTEVISIEDAGANESENTNIINIALLGLDDDGGETHHSDVMKIISLNLDDESVTINSLQRDNLIYIPGDEPMFDKLNYAYKLGGPELTLQTFNYNLDLDITRYVTFDFTSVPKIVDLVGGVNIALSKEEASLLKLGSVASTYTLNGEQALSFSRIRSLDSDYRRMERQNRVISAILSKVTDLGLTELFDLIKQVLPLIETNLTNHEIKSYVTGMMGFNMDKLSQYQFPANEYDDIMQSIQIDGYGPYYIMKDFSATVEQLHHNIYKNDVYKASTRINELEQEIIEKYYTGE